MYRAIFGAVARRRYKTGLAALERGDCESPLGTSLHSKPALRLWCERLHRLLSAPRFELHDGDP